MSVFSKNNVIDTFEGTFRERVALPDGLEDLWFDIALGQLEMELGEIEYNDDGSFGENVPRAIINALAYMMKVLYCEREVSRVNKINNIITKDVSLNGNGDTKKYAAEEHAQAIQKAAETINKLKTSWYEN